VQKERLDSVKERKKLVDDIKDSTQAMLAQNQHLRAASQSPLPSSPIPSPLTPTPDDDNKENVSSKKCGEQYIYF
jgi:hypothetical protein